MTRAKTVATAATRGWVRVRLAGPAAPEPPGRLSLTEGELILRADRVAADGEHMVFLVGDEPVYRLERCYYRSHAWFVDRPTFAEWLRERRETYPNARTAWSDEEVDRLRAEVAAGAPWPAIAAAHGRSETAARRQAAFFGFTRRTRS